MTDSISERKEVAQPEIIRLDQDFSLFDPRKTVYHSPFLFQWGLSHFERQEILKLNIFMRPITLRTDLLPDLPLQAEGEGRMRINDLLQRGSLTPFNPELGYQLSEEDWDLETRIQKLINLKAQDGPLYGPARQTIADLSSLATNNPKLSRGYIYSRNANTIVRLKDIGVGETLKRDDHAEAVRVGDEFSIVLKPGTPNEKVHHTTSFVKNAFKFKPEALETLRRLRLQLFFPDFPNIEAEPEELHLQKYGTIRFEKFHPFNRPLPVASKERIELDRQLRRLFEITYRGLDVVTPHHLNQLSKIRAKFVMVP